MGKGDKKSKRGKITIGSFGVKRRKKSTNKNNVTMAGPLTGIAPSKNIKAKSTKPAKKEASVKKVAAKKSAEPAAPKKKAKKAETKE